MYVPIPPDDVIEVSLIPSIGPALRELTNVAEQEEAFRWSLGLISRSLGSVKTLVMPGENVAQVVLPYRIYTRD